MRLFSNLAKCICAVVLLIYLPIILQTCYNVVLTLISPAITKETRNNAWYRDIEGDYSGQVNNTEAIETHLHFDENSKVVGSYESHDQGKAYTGKLSQVRPFGDHSLVLNWNDRYGSGTLELAFTPDCKSFSGKFSSLGWFQDPWTGTKQARDP